MGEQSKAQNSSSSLGGKLFRGKLKRQEEAQTTDKKEAQYIKPARAEVLSGFGLREEQFKGGSFRISLRWKTPKRYIV